MTPAEYVEKTPRFTAVQWDGTTEASEWILSVYNGSQRSGDDLVVLDSMDREQVVPRGVWVLYDPTRTEVTVVEDAAFTARYEPGE